MRIDSVGQAVTAATAAVQGPASAPSAHEPRQTVATPAPASAQAPAPVYDPAAAMHNAVASINRYLRDSDRNVQFDIDHSTGKTVVRVIDASTHEVIRQMPSEETLAIARAISRMSGLLLNEQA